MTGEQVHAVDHDYLWALEVLANKHFDAGVTRSEYREARRIVANRTGRDAPLAWEG